MAPGTKLVDLILHPEDAVAGHEGVMISDTGEIIVKPCTPAEIAFYESIAAEHADFAEITPVFMGHVNISTQAEKDKLSSPDPMSVSAALQHQMHTAQALADPGTASMRPQRGARLQTDVAVALGNVAAGFIKPNILDIKLGRRLWADDAPQEKKDKLTKVSAATTSGSMGMRIAGMRVWRPPVAGSAVGSSITKHKDYGKSLTDTTILDACQEFFCDGEKDGRATLSAERYAVVQLCDDALERIEQVLKENETRMYSSSILFVYEGDSSALRKAFEAFQRLQEAENMDNEAESSASDSRDADKHASEDQAGNDNEHEQDKDDDEDEDLFGGLPRILEAKLIDFAHAQWVPGDGPDENVLVGIKSTRTLLSRLLKEGGE